MARPVVFLDACVLYPPLVRGIVLGAAEPGLFTPRWSPRVLDEWRIASARKRGAEADDTIEPARQEMAARFPEASVAPDVKVTDALTLPDAADAHVLAAAIAAGAGVLLTFNVRDFPARRLAAHGIAPRHPDGFIWELFSFNPQAMTPVLVAAGAEAGAHDPEPLRRALKRAKLSRLARAWKTHIESTP